jgi:hypothetical protein
MHENAARALQYYEDLPRRSGRPELRLVDSEPRTRRHMGEEVAPSAEADQPATPDAAPAPDLGLDTARPARPDRHASRTQRRGEPAHRSARPRPRPRRPRPQPLAPPRPQAAAPRLAGRPDRVAMWAVILGFFLTAVAAATGHG